MSEKTIIWVHGDNLNPHNPAFRTAPDAPAVFVWDDALLAEWGIGLKRITFMYECLLELPVVIRRGDVVTELLNFAHEHDAVRILTMDSPSPRFEQFCHRIRQQLPAASLQVLHPEPFVDYEGDIDLKRFFRYWRTVQSRAMK